MKKLTLALCVLSAVASAAFAGTETYSGKEMKQTMPAPCPTWYADNEWNVGLSGVYAPTTNHWFDDNYLGQDHAWGGALDVKYFFRRYFGIGVQGFGLSLNDRGNRFVRVARVGDDNNFAGGVLGTFTFRYPIPCSRFAPYAWAGVGGIWGGGEDRLAFNGNNFFVNRNTDGRIMGQYGAGFETRITSHIGWTNDISYNQVDGGENDFLQIRTGLNFAF